MDEVGTHQTFMSARAGRVNATDADAGANGELECVASSYAAGSPARSPLEVSSDCRVTLRAGVLDRETQSQHRLAVVVRDRGTCVLPSSSWALAL